jgi:putative transposase
LQNRGFKDIFIACVDGLIDLPEAIEVLYPHTRVQLCMVHMVRNSLKYVSYKHRKEVAADLKLIYSAATETEAQVYLELFAEKWDRQYGSISKMWRMHWSHVVPLFAFPEDIRKVIYTTNATRSVNMSLRKVTRNHRIFPPMRQSTRWCTWPCTTLPRSGPCRSATGCLHSTVLRLNLGSDSLIK